jgi:hypothetical protein
MTRLGKIRVVAFGVILMGGAGLATPTPAAASTFFGGCGSSADVYASCQRDFSERCELISWSCTDDGSGNLTYGCNAICP